MKIELEVPEWAIGRHIHIFAGTELLADKQFRREKISQGDKVIIKEYYLPLEIKTGRCSGCGACCATGLAAIIYRNIKQALDEHLERYGRFKDGQPCPFLSATGCSLGAFIPFSCARSVCSAYPGCTEKMEEVK